jgi:glycosyltransferase involved in cell wall biosynthesis
VRIVAHNGARIVGGAERRTIALLAGLQERGHDVRLLCNQRVVADHAGRCGVPAELASIGGDVALWNVATFARTLRRLAPDVVVFGTFKKLPMGALAARWAQVPVVVARVGLSNDVPRAAKYRLAIRRWTDVVVLNAESMRAPFAAALPVTGVRLEVIANGVVAPDRRGEPGALRRALGIPEGSPIIGTVGRLSLTKRHDRLMHALSRLPASVHCVIAGDGTRGGETMAAARAVGVADRLHLLGHRDDVGDVLAALDVFVLSSDVEGMSGAMLEAMAAGVPVVSTRVSGAEEALTEGSESPAGIVVDRDPGQLADALRALLEDAPRRDALGAAARARVAGRFGYDRMVERWEALLASALASALAGGPA